MVYKKRQSKLCISIINNRYNVIIKNLKWISIGYIKLDNIGIDGIVCNIWELDRILM